MTRQCRHKTCQAAFDPVVANQVYCCDACRDAGRRERYAAKCRRALKIVRYLEAHCPDTLRRIEAMSDVDA